MNSVVIQDFYALNILYLGVADQLQTNYASDLRNILKSVFDMNCSQSQTSEDCDNSTSVEYHDEVPSESSYREETFNDNNSSVLNSDMSSTLLNNNAREEDDRDRSSVDSAEEVVPDNTLTPPLVISEVNQENENNRNIHAGMFLSYACFVCLNCNANIFSGKL